MFFELSPEYEILEERPYSKSEEIIVFSAEQGRSVDIVHAMDNFFEVNNVSVQFVGLGSADEVLDPQPSVLGELWTMGLLDISSNMPIAKMLPLRKERDNLWTWDCDKPFRLSRGEGLHAAFSTRPFLVSGRINLKKMRAVISLNGSLLIVRRKK